MITLGVQGSIWFFGAETPQSGVILVAGREPGCLVCLAIAAFLLPKNSAGPAGGQKSGLARPQDEGGLNLPPRTRTQPTLILAAGRHVAPCTPRVQVHDTEIKLTRTEYAILKLMLQNQTQVISKSLLLDRISEDTPDCTESSLKMHISNLRKKLRDAGGKAF